jgi:hypothetical protein
MLLGGVQRHVPGHANAKAAEPHDEGEESDPQARPAAEGASPPGIEVSYHVRSHLMANGVAPQ